MTDFSSLKKLSIDGVSLKQLFVGGIQVFKSGYTNQVPLSIDTDGNLYNGVGYKDGYRIRSGGAEAEQPGARVTGFIPACAGDIIRLTGWNFGFAAGANAVNFADASFSNLGQFTQQPSGYGICLGNIPTVTVTEDVYQFTVPENVSITYIRVTGYHDYNTLPPDMIITVNEEI
jgi:hypothetical protein